LAPTAEIRETVRHVDEALGSGLFEPFESSNFLPLSRFQAPLTGTKRFLPDQLQVNVEKL